MLIPRKLLVGTATGEYTIFHHMRPTETLSPETERYLRTGKLLDAAGFGGRETSFDLVDFIEAASDVIPFHSDTDEYHKYIRSSLVKEYEELHSKGYRDGNAASYLLGSSLWRVAANDPTKDSGIEVVLTRAVHDIVLSRRTLGYGNERIFHMGFSRYTMIFGPDYPPHERRRLQKLCMLIEDESCQARRAKELAESFVAPPSYRQFLLGSLAGIALMHGVYAPQPNYPTDEKADREDVEDQDDAF